LLTAARTQNGICAFMPSSAQVCINTMAGNRPGPAGLWIAIRCVAEGIPSCAASGSRSGATVNANRQIRFPAFESMVSQRAFSSAVGVTVSRAHAGPAAPERKARQVPPRRR
jgi:hypothetical protein